MYKEDDKVLKYKTKSRSRRPKEGKKLDHSKKRSRNKVSKQQKQSKISRRKTSKGHKKSDQLRHNSKSKALMKKQSNKG